MYDAQKAIEDLLVRKMKLTGSNLQFVPEKYQTLRVVEAALDSYAGAIEYVYNQTEETVLPLLERQGALIGYIKNPTEAMYRVAIEGWPRSIERIPAKDQEYWMCELAVQEAPGTLGCCTDANQTYELCMKAVTASGHTYKLIRSDEMKANPSICRRTVQTLPEMLRHVLYQDLDMCIEAVKQEPRTIAYVRPELQTKEMWVAAVNYDSGLLYYCPSKLVDDDIRISALKNDYSALRYISAEDQTEEMQLVAVRANGSSLYNCHKPTLKVQEEAVRQNPRAIKYAKDQTEYIQLLAVTKDPYALIHIIQPTLSVCLKAVTRDKTSIIWVPKKYTEECGALIKSLEEQQSC